MGESMVASESCYSAVAVHPLIQQEVPNVLLPLQCLTDDMCPPTSALTCWNSCFSFILSVYPLAKPRASSLQSMMMVCLSRQPHSSPRCSLHVPVADYILEVPEDSSILNHIVRRLQTCRACYGGFQCNATYPMTILCT